MLKYYMIEYTLNGIKCWIRSPERGSVKTTMKHTGRIFRSKDSAQHVLHTLLRSKTHPYITKDLNIEIVEYYVEIKICQHCGKDIPHPRIGKSYAKRKFCSLHCQAKGRYRKKYDRHVQVRKVINGIKHRKCKRCGEWKELKTNFYGTTNPYCKPCTAQYNANSKIEYYTL